MILESLALIIRRQLRVEWTPQGSKFVFPRLHFSNPFPVMTSLYSRSQQHLNTFPAGSRQAPVAPPQTFIVRRRDTPLSGGPDFHKLDRRLHADNATLSPAFRMNSVSHPVPDGTQHPTEVSAMPR